MTDLFNFQIINMEDLRWLDFIAVQPESVVFHHPAWVQMVADCYRYRPFAAVIFDADGQIQAGVPVIEIDPLIGKPRWVSLPFTDHCQPIYSTPEARQALQTGLLKAHKDAGVSTLELRWNYPLSGMQASSEFVQTKIDLSVGVEELLSRIKSNHRRKFRSALRRGIRVQNSTSLESVRKYYRLQVQTRCRLGVPVQPWRFFALMQERVFEQGLGFVSLAEVEGDVCAGVIYLNWNQHLIYKFAASNDAARKNYASDLLMWQGIEWGCQNQFTDLDLGRSRVENEGLRQYKLRWAAEEIPLVYTGNHSSAEHGLLRRFLPLVAAVIHHSPAWVCRFSGQCFYRYFG